MRRRKPAEVTWGAWDWARLRSAMVRHAEDKPAPPADSITDDPDLELEAERTGWWRCVPVRGEDWDVEWREARRRARGAWHGTLFVEVRE